MLGPPWQIDLERREVPDAGRPAGLIETGEIRVRRARIAIPQGNVEYFMPVTVTLYPSLAKPREAGRTARMLEYGLHQLIAVGAEGPVFQGGRPASGPERIPLYDFSPVPLDGTGEERAEPDYPHDVLWAEDFGTTALQDPMDPQRWTVVLEMRCSWEAPGRVPPEDPIVTSMPQTLDVA